jgi:ATP-dependent NAD(P)H-hydrate dehydratase
LSIHLLTTNQSHVICDLGAGSVIKTYSPNLMVHPYLRGTHSISPKEDASTIASRISETLLPRLHVLILGPGLSRDPPLLSQAALILSAAREKNLPVVIDADGLLLVAEEPARVKGWDECILTPNIVEFERLCKVMNVEPPKDTRDQGQLIERVKALAKALDGPIILAKGKVDVISAPRGIGSVISDWKGGLKRSGGQGDTLTGALGTFLAWRKGYLDGLWGEEEKERMGPEETMLVCAWAGSAVTRECSRLAYLEKGRSMQAGDLTEKVHEACLNVIGEPADSRL